MNFHTILTGERQPNIGALDALLTACGHTPLRHIQQHYDAERGCWCVRGEVETMSRPMTERQRIEKERYLSAKGAYLDVQEAILNDRIVNGTTDTHSRLEKTLSRIQRELEVAHNARWEVLSND